MDIDLKTALSELLQRARALSRAMEVANLQESEHQHLHVMMDEQLKAAIEALEASGD